MTETMAPRLKNGLLIVLCAALAGCVTPPRLALPPNPGAAAPPGFSPGVRIVGPDPVALAEGVVAADRIRAAAAAGDGTVDLLALSGGGAGGAFSAGALAGLTDAGARPTYEVVTGVSTGALVAPFAFLGPDWDGPLAEAYRGAAPAGILQLRWLGALFRPGLYRGAPLRRLIESYVTDSMLSAIAAEGAKGRYLLVATTDLDTEQTVIWDMTRIAAEGGSGALPLFRDLLVASASVPGVFPPVMLEVTEGGRLYQEMHVDGGVTAPFFLGPDPLELSGPTVRMDGVRVQILINGQFQPAPEATERNTVAIMERSMEAVTTAMVRSELERSARLADRYDAAFQFSFIPTAYQYEGSLEFDTEQRRALFDFARACARQGRLWLQGDTLSAAIARSQAAARADGGAPDCPGPAE